MSPAEELRAAAATIRERAEKATPGSWVAATGRGKLGVVGVVGPAGPGSGVAVAVSGTPGEAKTANARHIATWGPAAALAVAAWLERIAETYESDPSDYCAGTGHPVIPGEEAECAYWWCENVDCALAVARAIGGQP